MINKALSRNDVLFVVSSVLIYVVIVLALPSYTPLIEPDSATYITFESFRPAYYPAFLALCRTFGFDLIATTWIQLGIFALALFYLLITLLRCGFPRIGLALVVGILASNILFSSFHRSILTESLYFSLGLIALSGWIDYLYTGRVVAIAIASLGLGLMIGVRFAGLGILPIHILTVWVKRPHRASRATALFVALAPLAVGIGGERSIHYTVHGWGKDTQVPYQLTGKSAMLIGPDMKFDGPHAAAVGELAQQLYVTYAPMQRYVIEAPSLPVRAQLSAAYESYAEYGVLSEAFTRVAQSAHTTPVALRYELGEQVIRQNLRGYLALSLLNAFGQWSVAAKNFPLIARATAAYADAHPEMIGRGGMTQDLLHQPATLTGLIAYPIFLLAGTGTLVLAFGFLTFVICPSLAETPQGFYLLVATYLGAVCHAYTLFISMVGVWTPRYVMAVFPHLEIIGLSVALAVIALWRGGLRKGASA